ncbi:hypothetical protein Bbelb_000390 [Branchiostoma belcheri]|nr:hypothetical protein Bbelb_000390 [Branchiostoma belcheri]
MSSRVGLARDSENSPGKVTGGHSWRMAGLRLEEEVVKFAVFSRILIILWQMVSNNLIPDHDAGVFNPPVRHPVGFGDHLIDVVLGGFSHWDSAHFLYIADHGYTIQKHFAFFPLFPTTVKTVSETVLFPLHFFMNDHSALLVTAVAVNVLFFVAATFVLFKLSVLTLHDRQLALRTALLFCINPAGIFMSAAYSESLFTFVSFYGMLAMERKHDFEREKALVLWHPAFPTENEEYLPPGSTTIPPWCNWTVPSAYSYIQDSFWDVGFLRYYQLKQIPNFVLAAPIIALCGLAVYSYCRVNWHVCRTLGLGAERKEGDDKPRTGFNSPQVVTRFLASSSPVIYWYAAHLTREDLQHSETNPATSENAAYPSNPVLQQIHNWKTLRRTTQAVLGYFIFYNVVGVALHSNFFNWT